MLTVWKREEVAGAERGRSASEPRLEPSPELAVPTAWRFIRCLLYSTRNDTCAVLRLRSRPGPALSQSTQSEIEEMVLVNFACTTSA